MTHAEEELRLGIEVDYITPSCRSYRPPSWPPPREWVVVEDRNGNTVSKWGDPTWNLAPWAGQPISLNFERGGKRSAPIDPANADLLRLLTTWRLWGPRPAVEAISLKTAFFSPMRSIVAACAEHRILVSDLKRYPRVLEAVAKRIRPSAYNNVLRTLHQLWDARDSIGFTVVDAIGIARLSELNPNHKKRQTPYIPPRIWTYQVLRLRECLADFQAHREQIEACFHFCVDTYAHNYGSLEAAMHDDLKRSLVPFTTQDKPGRGSISGKQYHGRFEHTAQRFGIKDLIERWIPLPDIGMTISQFSTYLSLADLAAQAYIANFTLQRIDEVTSLRSDCLVWETDERLGRIPIICGETTKTIQDSDARWPTSPSIEIAVDVAAAIAKMRMRCAAADSRLGATKADKANPCLFQRAFEPWAIGGRALQPYDIRPSYQSYQNALLSYPLLFSAAELTITESDLKIAERLTPGLGKLERFQVGQVWPLAWHQLRRTGAVNMFASGELSDASMQFLMKHSSRLMPLYYGRGYTSLLLNKEVNEIIATAMYESMGRKFLASAANQFVSPLGEERKQIIIVNLVGDKDAKRLAAAGRRGSISLRETRVGLCAKRGLCEFGGIESVSRCTGGADSKPCGDALFDAAKRPAIDAEIRELEVRLSEEPVGSPRHRALHAEVSGLNRYMSLVDPVQLA